MLDRIKKSLLFAVCCSIGGVLGCILMRTYSEWIKLLQFFVVEFIVSFVFHFLLIWRYEKAKSKKQ